MSHSLRESLDLGKRALQSGDPTSALQALHEVIVAADESTIALYGRALTWVGECYVALGQGDEAETSHVVAITTLSGFAPDAEELRISLKHVRASQDIGDDEPDGFVVATAWKLDAIAKASERDSEGVYLATRQATSTIAATFGNDHPRQAEVFAHVAVAMAFVDPEHFSGLIDELTGAGLRVVPDDDITDRALLVQARLVERLFRLEIAEAIELCDAGIALTAAQADHEASAEWFRATRVQIDDIVAKLAAQ
jgi:hypothetical protein